MFFSRHYCCHDRGPYGSLWSHRPVNLVALACRVLFFVILLICMSVLSLRCISYVVHHICNDKYFLQYFSQKNYNLLILNAIIFDNFHMAGVIGVYNTIITHLNAESPAFKKTE